MKKITSTDDELDHRMMLLYNGANFPSESLPHLQWHNINLAQINKMRELDLAPEQHNPTMINKMKSSLTSFGKAFSKKTEKKPSRMIELPDKDVTKLGLEHDQSQANESLFPSQSFTGLLPPIHQSQQKTSLTAELEA